MGKLFETTELLDIVKHKGLRWHCLGGMCPTSCCYVPHRSTITLEESLELANYFPIVFFVVEKDGQKRQEFCIVFKLEKAKKCVYLQEGIGCVLGDKKPLACKQYPLSIVKDSMGRDLVMIDRTCPGFSEDTGELLFPEHGKLNPYFEGNFLKPAKMFIEGLKEAQLFVNTMFSYNLVVGGRFSYRGVEVQINLIDENRLMELPREVLIDFKNRGYMRYIYAHLNSLQHMRRLIDDYLKEESTTIQKEETVFVLNNP